MKRGIVAGLVAGGALLLLSGGYAAWSAVAASQQNARWDAEVNLMATVAAANGADSLEISDDRSVVQIASGPFQPCTSTEELAVYSELLDQYLAPYGLTTTTIEFAPGGALIAGIVVRQATTDAPIRCESVKRAVHMDAVQRARLAASTLLTSLGASSAEIGRLDRSGEVVVQTDAGPVEVRVENDSDDGLTVAIVKERVAFDWYAPLAAIGL